MLDDYSTFQKNYDGESDRSVAILAASYAEQFLEQHIRAKLVDDSGVDRLFKGYAPLATFAAKIDMAFALGLIPTHIHDNLRVIKKLRNLFAHEPTALSFTSGQVRDICQRLHGVRKSDGGAWAPETTRAKYLNAVFFALFHIEAQEVRTHRIRAANFHIEIVVGDE